MYDLYEGQARSKAIELVKEFEPKMGVAKLDPKGIHTVLSNLISNAMAACSSQTGAEKNLIIVRARVEEGWLQIQVTDDGCGMPEEVKENLFRKFYSTKGAKGTGLGLVVTRKIIEEHGGRIREASRLGQGTTFSVEIPMKPAEKQNTLRKAV